MATLFLLAWYAKSYNPKTCIEYGAKKGFTASIVASICPNIEIYGIDVWSGIAMPWSPHNLAFLLHDSPVHYRGYARFLNGNPESARERLMSSVAESFCPDLIVFDGQVFDHETLSPQLKQALHDLAPGGALVHYNLPRANIQIDWLQFQHEFPELRFIQVPKF